MPGGWGNPLVLAAVGAMVLALAVRLQWRSRVLCRGVWPWLRWCIAFIDFWFWLPIVTTGVFGLLYAVYWMLPGRVGASWAAVFFQGVEAYPAFLIAPAAGLILYKSWLLYFLSRWDPVRSLFRPPAWPHQPFSRGPRQRAAREFREPLPWDRGPGSW